LQQAKDFFGKVYQLLLDFVEILTYENILNCWKKCFEFSKSNILLIMVLMAEVYQLFLDFVERLTYENILNCRKKCFEFSKSNILLILVLMAAMVFTPAWYFAYLENQLIKIQKDEMTSSNLHLNATVEEMTKQIISKDEFI